MDIVIDFDGTVVAHEFPRIGGDIGAVPVLHDLVAAGHNLILFTMRSDSEDGNYLMDAVNWFAERGIPLYGIQTNPSQRAWTSSPKAYGQIIIDDAALGCPLRQDDHTGMARPYVDWDEVRTMLVRMGILAATDTTQSPPFSSNAASSGEEGLSPRMGFGRGFSHTDYYDDDGDLSPQMGFGRGG